MNPLDPRALFFLDDFEHQSLFAGCTFAWDALKGLSTYLERYPLGKKQSVIPDGVHLVNPHLITIGKDCVIEPGAYIEGPCIIGEGSTIRHGSYIRGFLITGSKCVVGHATEIKHSILLNNAKAAHFNYVGDSILGGDTNLGAGTICANLRFDAANIHVKVDGDLLDTGMHKLGLILGDGAQMGCNSVASPGTIMGRGARCCPCVNVGGVIPAGYIVKGQKFTVEA